MTVGTFSARFPQLSIQTYDSGPLSSEDLIHPAVIEVTQEMTTMKAETVNLTLPVPQEGKVLFSFALKEEVLKLFIRVRLQLPQPIMLLLQWGDGLPHYEQFHFLFSVLKRLMVDSILQARALFDFLVSFRQNFNLVRRP